MFAINICNSSQSITKFFRAFRQAKLSIRFSQFSAAITSDSNAGPPDSADFRRKAVLSFLYCITSNNVLSCCYCTDKSLDVCIFARFEVNCEVMPIRNFANFRLVMNFKLVMSRQSKELRGALKSAGP